MNTTLTLFPILTLLSLSCGGTDGTSGEPASPGAPGTPGAPGSQGPPGPAGGSAGASGSRLKMQVYTSADGAVAPNGFWDSKRQEPCVVVPDSQGTLRCLPSFSLSAPSIGYTDATCTTPLFVAATTGCIPKYGYTYGPQQCSGLQGGMLNYVIHTLAPMPTPATIYYKNSTTGACTAGAPVDGYRYYTGPRIPDTEFAEIMLKTL